MAWKLGQEGLFNEINRFEGPDARFITWFIAIPYSLLGRSVMLAQSVSLIFGIGCIYLGWLVAKKIWDKNIAKKVAWTIALFPSLILYSVLVMREVYMVFFILIAIHGITDWTKKNNLSSIIVAILGFVGATFFHGAMFIGALVFVAFLGIHSLKRFLNLIKI